MKKSLILFASSLFFVFSFNITQAESLDLNVTKDRLVQVLDQGGEQLSGFQNPNFQGSWTALQENLDQVTEDQVISGQITKEKNEPADPEAGNSQVTKWLEALENFFTR